MQKVYAKINTSSHDAMRRLSWELAKNHFKASVTQLEKGSHQEAKMSINEALQYLDRFNDAESHLKKNEPFVSANYSKNNSFKDSDEYKDFLGRLQQQKQLCEVQRLMKSAENKKNKAVLDKENVDMDLMHDALDLYNDARNASHLVDPENEAVVAAHIGHIYYQGLKNSEKAWKYYCDCLRLLETIKPKTFNDKKWHQNMMKNMDEINKAI